jgi:homoserine kinase type II
MKDSIIADLKNSYGLICNRITPVTGGLLNLKWKVSTEKGELLVKQYSTKRFRREQIERIESALQRQVILEKNGVPCPFIWQYRDRVIRWLDDKTAYMVMDFRSGKTEKANTITITQM